MKNVYTDGMFVAYYEDGGAGDKVTMMFINEGYETDAEVVMKPAEKVNLKKISELVVSRRHEMCICVNDTVEITPVTITWPDNKKSSAFRIDWEEMESDGEDDGNILIEHEGRDYYDEDWDEY